MDAEAVFVVVTLEGERIRWFPIAVRAKVLMNLRSRLTQITCGWSNPAAGKSAPTTPPLGWSAAKPHASNSRQWWANSSSELSLLER